MANFDARAMKSTRARPDTSPTMKRVDEAAAHDAWFREQVKLGVFALDAGQVLSEARHVVHRAKHRNTLISRLLLLNGQMNRKTVDAAGDSFTAFLEKEIDPLIAPSAITGCKTHE